METISKICGTCERWIFEGEESFCLMLCIRTGSNASCRHWKPSEEFKDKTESEIKPCGIGKIRVVDTPEPAKLDWIKIEFPKE